MHADLGVRVFFVISGFLITSLLLKERVQSGSISLRLFYIRRALRILPAFFLFIGCAALLSFLGVIRVPPVSWAYVLTYTVNFAPYPPFPWVLVHLWSLSVEEQFYLLWPLVMKSAGKRTWTAVAIVAIVANPVSHVAHSLSGADLPGYGPFPLVCGPLAMGCLLAMYARTIRNRIVSSKILSDGWVLLLTVLILLLFDANPGFGLGVITNLLLTFCIARVVFIPEGLVGRVLNSAPFVTVGKLSYSLYLWQEFFFKPAGIAPIALPPPFNLAASIAAASVSYWGLEVRFLGLRKKFRNQAQPVLAKT